MARVVFRNNNGRMEANSEAKCSARIYILKGTKREPSRFVDNYGNLTQSFNDYLNLIIDTFLKGLFNLLPDTDEIESMIPISTVIYHNEEEDFFSILFLFKKMFINSVRSNELRFTLPFLFANEDIYLITLNGYETVQSLSNLDVEHSLMKAEVVLSKSELINRCDILKEFRNRKAEQVIADEKATSIYSRKKRLVTKESETKNIVENKVAESNKNNVEKDVVSEEEITNIPLKTTKEESKDKGEKPKEEIKKNIKETEGGEA